MRKLLRRCNKNFDTIGFSLPAWAELVFNKSRDVLEYFAAIKYESFTHTTEMKKIKGGFILKEIFDTFKIKTRDKLSPPRHMVLYFTHGHTIVNILNTLNVFEVKNDPAKTGVFNNHFN